MTRAKNHTYLGWSVLILLGALGVRVWDLGRSSLWLDEVDADQWVKVPLGQLFDILMADCNHTPLYYVFLHFFRTDSEFLLRLPGALLGVVGVALIMFVAMRLYGDHRLALWSGALLAFNPYHVWISRMARPYAMLFVWTLLASYLFLWLVSGKQSRACWIGFIVSHAAAYMTHHFGLLLPATQYLLMAFVIRQKPVFLRRWLGAQLIAGFPLLLWVYALFQQPRVAPGISWIPRPAIKDLWITFWNMTVGYDGRAHHYMALGLIVASIGLLLGLVYAVRHARLNKIDFYWLWLIIAPFTLVYIVSTSFQSLYVDRYFTPVLPALIFLLLRGWQPRSRWRTIPILLLLFVGGFNIASTLSSHRDERQDWRSVTAYIRQHDQSGDGILVQATNELNAFIHYFGQDQIMHLNVYGVSQGSENIYPIYEASELPTRLWAIYRDDHGQHIFGVVPYRINPFQRVATPMATWLAARQGNVLSEKEFRGLTVVLVQVESGDLIRPVSDN